MTVSVNISGLEGIAEAIQSLARAMGTSGVTANLSYKKQADAPAVSGGYPTGVPTAPVQQSAPANLPGGSFPSGGAPTNLPGGAFPSGGAPANLPGGAFPSGGAPANLPGMSGPVPTTASAPAYTQDQIAVAMTGLVDQGKQPQVMQVLSQFGAGSLMQVPKEQYGALATQLRMLGANL